MSSPERARAAKPKAAAKKAPAARVVKKIPAAPKTAAEPNEASRAALALAATIEKALRDGDLAVVSEEAQQALNAALMKLYGANSEAGNRYTIVRPLTAVTSTDVMVACAALLKSSNLQVFELGMWQSWTGR